MLQQIIGTFLFYGRAVDNTMLVALGTLAAAQTQGTEKTMEATMQLLDYAATHPDAAVRFHKSDVVLYCHSDASYLSERKARSRVGGFFYLGNKDEPEVVTKPNGPIHIESKILKHVQKRRLEPSSTMARRQSTSDKSYRRWAESRQPLPGSPRTTPQQTDLPTNAPRASAPKQWTCASGGSQTGLSKASWRSGRHPANTTSPTTTPTTIPLPTTSRCGPSTCTVATWYRQSSHYRDSAI
jgi:hypothetical protein